MWTSRLRIRIYRFVKTPFVTLDKLSSQPSAPLVGARCPFEMSGRTAGRVSGYPVWQQTPVSSRSVARRARERGKERARRRGRGWVGERGRYERSFVSVAARTGNTKYGRHLVFSFGHERAFGIYFFHGKFQVSLLLRKESFGANTAPRSNLRAQAFSGEVFEHVTRATSESSFFAHENTRDVRYVGETSTKTDRVRLAVLDRNDPKLNKTFCCVQIFLYCMPI